MKKRETTSQPANDDAVDTGVDVDVDATMERIRSRVAPGAAARTPIPAPLADPRPDLATLHASSDVLRPALGSHRKVAGPAVLFLKRLLLRFLTPSLESQTRHNASATRLLTHFALRLERLESELESSRARIAALEAGRPRGAEAPADPGLSPPAKG